MKPYYHAKLSAKKHGGIPEDYLPIHDFFDSAKESYCDLRQRALLHSSFGIYMAEKVFGCTLENSDGKKYIVRDIAEEHVFQDMGFIPTVKDYLQHLEIQPWMYGRSTEKKSTKKIKMSDFDLD